MNPAVNIMFCFLLFFLLFGALLVKNQWVNIRANLKNAWYLFRHKLYVWQAGRALKVPLRRLICHDFSKMSRAEWWPYARHFHAPGTTDEEKEASLKAFKEGWKHHIELNDHHPEYWTRKGRKGTQMPDEAIREMVADWWAAGKAQGKTQLGELREWWESQRVRITALLGSQNARLVSWYVTCLTFWERVGMLPDDISYGELG